MLFLFNTVDKVNDFVAHIRTAGGCVVQEHVSVPKHADEHRPTPPQYDSRGVVPASTQSTEEFVAPLSQHHRLQQVPDHYLRYLDENKTAVRAALPFKDGEIVPGVHVDGNRLTFDLNPVRHPCATADSGGGATLQDMIAVMRDLFKHHAVRTQRPQLDKIASMLQNTLSLCDATLIQQSSSCGYYREEEFAHRLAPAALAAPTAIRSSTTSAAPIVLQGGQEQSMILCEEKLVPQIERQMRDLVIKKTPRTEHVTQQVTLKEDQVREVQVQPALT
eukprot:TRINITY_DN13340_c0_g1_i1.p1 TRINITY_DN13340_c0_g1~~TRINITY_DN13340_c0_g1_i1.p1  ORF type:complete len:276 (-),score=80.01 TRINITY_DN13340_c0_g1_i1:228-1055(-)